jgi:CBS domain-containing protein
MVEWSISDKTRNALFLLFGSIVYLSAISSLIVFLSKVSPIDATIVFVFAMLPLIGILLIVGGYGLRVRLPQAEIEYYPVERVMKEPAVITDNKTGRDAEILMDRLNTDFINVVGKRGALKGVFTRADAHKARTKNRINESIKKLMTRRVVYANQKENLRDILEKIGKTKHSRLPILDENNRVLGIVDAVDIGELLSELYRK